MNWRNKKILFITTKNLDYIRNTQELKLLVNQAESVKVIGSMSGSYVKRLLFVYWNLVIINCRNYDQVFIGFSPQLVLPFFFWKFKKKEIVIDFFISVYDTFVCDRRIFADKSIIATICKYVDRYTLEKASWIISDTMAHGNYFSEEFGIERDKIHTLYLEADQDIFYPRFVEKEEQYKEKYIVLYFGSVLPLQGVDIILKSIEIEQNNPALHFILIGPINKMYDVPEWKNISYYPWLSQENLADKIAEADLCLAGHFNADISKAKRTIPGKAYIYKAMGKPMILGDNEANRELFHEDMKGIHFVSMGDPKALAEKIEELYKRGKVRGKEK